MGVLGITLFIAYLVGVVGVCYNDLKSMLDDMKGE